MFATIGNAYNRRENYREAIRWYQEGIRRLQKQKDGNESALATSYGSLGTVFRKNNDVGYAIECYQQAVFYFQQRLNDPKTEESYKARYRKNIAYLHNNLGRAKLQNQEYHEALGWFRLFIQSDDISPNDRTNVLHNLGLTFSGMNVADSAFIYLNEAADLSKSALKKSEISIDKVEALMGVGQIEKAERLLHKSMMQLDTMKDEKARLYRMIAYRIHGELSLLGSTEKIAEGFSAFQKGLQIGSNDFNENGLTENPRSDQIQFEKQLIGFLFLKAKLARHAFNTTHKRAFLEIGMKAIDACLSIIDDQRLSVKTETSRLWLGEKWKSHYELAIWFCLKQYEFDENQPWLAQAFQYAEKSKAAVLREATFGRQALFSSGLPDSLAFEENQRQNDIAWLNKQLSKTTDPIQEDSLQIRLFEEEEAYRMFIKHLESE
ncbi:MAG: tetratricopeptide repeat protein, partial [Bacteroidota bacterium]